jgi:heme-degrading monooxygenase HmoA
METKMILFIYKEQSSTEFSSFSHLPFPICESAKVFSENNFRIFKSLGGLRIIDYYSSPFEFVRLSFWKTQEDYLAWEKNPSVQKYIETRTSYHKDFNIKTQILGPFQTSTYE